MPAGAAPTVVWTPNVEIIMALANLTEAGQTFQPKAVSAMRRAVWLRFDGDRRAPAVVETARLLEKGFWLDALAELALAAEPFPKAGFTYPLAHETLLKAGDDRDDGYTRLERYLEYAAAFTIDADVLDFLKLQGNAYRAAVEELEISLGPSNWVGPVEAWFGTAHRSVLTVASLLLPAGFSFGFSLGTPEGAYAFSLLGPFVGEDGSTSFTDTDAARAGAERELVRAFVKPVIAGAPGAVRQFDTAFRGNLPHWRPLGYDRAAACLEDHLVHAVQARLLVRRGEADAAAGMVRYDEENGFVYARALSEGLEDYEMHRADFPTLDAFFPHLMDYLLQ
jgi:hypothetical protein